MPEMKSAGPPGPEMLMQLQFAMAGSRVIAVATQLAVFTHMAQGKRTAAEIARAASASERGTRMLLDALVAFGLVAKKGASYENTPLAAEFLVRTSPSYMGGFAERDSMWESWTRLGDVVRSGKPLVAVEKKENAEQFFPVLVRTLHIMNREPARRAAQALAAGRKGLKVVDIACGSGVWGIALAEADRDARVTAQDFPGVLDVTRELAKRHGVLDRFDFLPGDLKRVAFGENRFDVAILGNIVHSEGELSSRDLMKRLAKAMKPGGKLAIVDMIPNDERTGPPLPVIFALNMLLHTETGDTYTLAEYRAWLEDAGFARTETHDIGSHSPLVVGVKG